MKNLFSYIFLFLFFAANGQDCELFFSQEPAASLQKDVYFLSDDALEGRAPGTKGEIMARDYITNRFTEAGLKGAGDNGTFSQVFLVPEPVKYTPEINSFLLNNKALTLMNDWFALPYTSNGKASGQTVYVNFGITAPELKYDDYAKITSIAGKIAVIDVSSPDGIHPHSAYAQYHDLGTRVDLALSKGAVGVVFVNLGDKANNPRSSFKAIRSKGIPVVFVSDKKEAAKLKKASAINLSVDVTEVKVEAYNVVGFLNNHQKTTIVIGAHYDHLGWGHDGSLHAGAKAIHNGADDNASGTAALMAFADFLSDNPEFAHHNYLFIAFTAEEKGLLGSNYFVNNPTINLNTVAYMINMDMVGRLREGNLQVSGTGTAEEWTQIFQQINCENIQFKLDPSGIGPSDHTSFYNKNIPVLHFFTGSHEDYHKPTDDADKVNFEGIERVMSIIKYIISQTAEKQFLTFTETKNENARNAPSFSVTLGIMPDYMYEAGGVKVDGVSADKPAAKAGIVKGDIILKIGNFDTQDMQGYMTALSAFKPGDKAIAVVLRNGKREEVKIQF